MLLFRSAPNRCADRFQRVGASSGRAARSPGTRRRPGRRGWSGDRGALPPMAAGTVSISQSPRWRHVVGSGTTVPTFGNKKERDRSDPLSRHHRREYARYIPRFGRRFKTRVGRCRRQADRPGRPACRSPGSPVAPVRAQGSRRRSMPGEDRTSRQLPSATLAIPVHLFGRRSSLCNARTKARHGRSTPSRTLRQRYYFLRLQPESFVVFASTCNFPLPVESYCGA